MLARRIRAVSNIRSVHYLSSGLFSSIESILLSDIVYISLFITVYTLMIIISKDIDTNENIERMYFQSRDRLRAVSNNFISFNMMCVYGNYIQVNRKYLSENWDQNAAAYFQNYWITNKENISRYFSAPNTQMMEEILFGDICQYLNEGSDYLSTIDYCRKYLPAQKGLVAVLAYEQQEFLDQYHALLSQSEWLEETKERITVQSVQRNEHLFFKKENIRLTFMHDSLVDVYIERLYRVMDYTLNESFMDISWKLDVITWISAGVLIVATITGFSITFRQMVINTEICRETFANILPETTFENPHILHAFENHFIKRT